MQIGTLNMLENNYSIAGVGTLDRKYYFSTVGAITGFKLGANFGTLTVFHVQKRAIRPATNSLKEIATKRHVIGRQIVRKRTFRRKTRTTNESLTKYN